MIITGTGFAGSGFRFNLRTTALQPVGAGAFTARDDRVTLASLSEFLLDLQQGSRTLDLSARVRRSTGARSSAPGLVSSASPLGLDLSAAATTLRSTEEVNAIPTSFSPFSPAFSGLSSASVLLRGVYDGSQGDDTLTFGVKETKRVGAETVELEVRNGAGDVIDTITFESGYVPGTPRAAFGIGVALSQGLAVQGDTFTVDVFASVGSAVDPSNPFNGTGNASPNFEPGARVRAGTFSINETAIDVAAGDSLNDVLDKINASSAGVTATFDARTESVVLSRDTTGPLSLVVDNDSTGFLAATKLDQASALLGRNPDHRAPIANVASLSAIASGDFQVNGVRITLDVTLDSLQDVLDRINSTVPGVLASYDEDEDAVTVRSLGSQPLTLAAGSSGFLRAVGLEEGSHVGGAVRGRQRTTFVRPTALRESLNGLAGGLHKVFAADYQPLAVGEGVRAQLALREAVELALAESGVEADRDLLRSGLGIDFDFREGASEVLLVDQRLFSRSLSRDQRALADFLLGDPSGGGGKGLLAHIESALEEAAKSVADRLAGDDGTGGLLDLRA